MLWSVRCRCARRVAAAAAVVVVDVRSLSSTCRIKVRIKRDLQISSSARQKRGGPLPPAAQSQHTISRLLLATDVVAAGSYVTTSSTSAICRVSGANCTVSFRVSHNLVRRHITPVTFPRSSFTRARAVANDRLIVV